ncbi:hypothetical protein HRbin04_01367 [archaeon HR04]|nr:hypothetical protein HRbin04_01367 [archaeon HR04]
MGWSIKGASISAMKYDNTRFVWSCYIALLTLPPLDLEACRMVGLYAHLREEGDDMRVYTDSEDSEA